MIQIIMEDCMIITLDSEQASLIVRALQDFREKFYECSRMDNDLDKPAVRCALDKIDRLKIAFQSKLNHIYNN